MPSQGREAKTLFDFTSCRGRSGQAGIWPSRKARPGDHLAAAGKTGRYPGPGGTAWDRLGEKQHHQPARAAGMEGAAPNHELLPVDLKLRQPSRSAAFVSSAPCLLGRGKRT